MPDEPRLVAAQAEARPDVGASSGPRPERSGSLHDPATAQRLGIAAIYQEPLLFPDLTVAENIFIGHQDCGLLPGRRNTNRRAEAILQALGMGTLAGLVA